MWFTYHLQRENEPEVSEMATAGRGAVMLFSHLLQRENESNVSEMVTARQGEVMWFTYMLQRENEPDVSGMGIAGETWCGSRTSYNARTSARRQRNGPCGLRRGDAVHSPPTTPNISKMTTAGGAR